MAFFLAEMQNFLIQAIVPLEKSIEAYQEKFPIAGLKLNEGQNSAALEIKDSDTTKNPTLLIKHLIKQKLILDFADALKNNADRFNEINQINSNEGEQKAREKLHEEIKNNLTRLKNLNPWERLHEAEWEINTFLAASANEIKLNTIEIKKTRSSWRSFTLCHLF